MTLRKSLVAACLGCCVAAALSLAGCATSQPTIFGDESASEAVVSVSDAMGKDVEAVLCKKAGSQDEYKQLGQAIWADADDAKLAFEQAGAFDIRINCTDGSYYEIHDVDAAVMSNAQLCYDAQLDLAYLIYKDANGSEVNTLESEKKWLEVRAAELKKAAEDQTVADKVTELIKAIGTVSLDSEKAIQKANSAYKKLTKDQRKLVKNYKTLKKAKKSLAKLQEEQQAAEEDARAQEQRSYDSDDSGSSDSGDSEKKSSKSETKTEPKAEPQPEPEPEPEPAPACDQDAF